MTTNPDLPQLLCQMARSKISHCPAGAGERTATSQTGAHGSESIALGLIGLAAMASLSSSGTGFGLVGAIKTLAASALWAAGSLAASRMRLPDDPAIGLVAQFVPTAMLLALTVWLTGIGASLHPSAVPLRVWSSLAFLIVTSTLVGYAVFLALNRSASLTAQLRRSGDYVGPGRVVCERARRLG